MIIASHVVKIRSCLNCYFHMTTHCFRKKIQGKKLRVKQYLFILVGDDNINALISEIFDQQYSFQYKLQREDGIWKKEERGKKKES